MTTTTQRNAPALQTGASENTGMNSLTRKGITMVKDWNLTDMVVDGPLSASRALSRDMFSRADVARFWQKVDLYVFGDGCRLWTAGVDGRGYGKVKVGGHTTGAHRVAYALSHGFVPAGLVVRHRCDTPKCCRPDHLTIGTHRDNSRDAVERGRLAEGESHGGAKLTVAAVNVMRRRARAGASYAELAREYGVDAAVVSDAVRGRSWQSATEPPVDEVRQVRRPWTEDEDAFVLRTLDAPAKMVAASLGRSYDSVESRRRDLRRRARQAVTA